MPVFLVGAGPGDPELLTLKGKRILESADAVLYDELANPALLDYAPAAAERCYVGKRARHHAVSQAGIADWMIARARRGLCVVRLKGGDPMVFGRGGEEIEALTRAGVAWEVVPGVSAGTGIASAAGIPLTHRGLASGVRFLAGHAGLRSQPPSADETLVIFMGLERLRESAAELIAQGWAPSTPVAVVERGTLPGERVVAGELEDIAGRVRRAGFCSPALVIVGEVVRWRRQLAALAPAPRLAAVDESLPGLILMAHGSPLPGWQLGVDRLARELAAPGQFTRAAYLPPVQPSLAEAVAAAVVAGVRRLAVVPYFLAPGLHVSRDLPELVEAERRRYPALHIALSACLEGHPALRTAVLARAGEVWFRPGVSLEHGTEPFPVAVVSRGGVRPRLAGGAQRPSLGAKVQNGAGAHDSRYCHRA